MQMRDKYSNISQLGIAFFAVILLVGVIIYFSTTDDQSWNNHTNYSTTSINEINFNLDRPDISWEQIQIFEESVKNVPTDSLIQLKNRITALKHILLICLMPDERKTQSLENAYLIYIDDLSVGQKSILKWYFIQDKRVRRLWEECDGVRSLTEFKDAVLEMMKRYDIKEINRRL